MMHDEVIINNFNTKATEILNKLKNQDNKAYISVDQILKSLTLSNKLKFYELTYYKECRCSELISMIRNKIKSFLPKINESELDYYGSIIYGIWLESVDIDLPVKSFTRSRNENK